MLGATRWPNGCVAGRAVGAVASRPGEGQGVNSRVRITSISSPKGKRPAQGGNLGALLQRLDGSFEDQTFVHLSDNQQASSHSTTTGGLLFCNQKGQVRLNRNSRPIDRTSDSA